MADGPNPPQADPSDYGAPENSKNAPPLAEEAKQEFDAVAEFTVPVELDQKMNGASAARPSMGLDQFGHDETPVRGARSPGFAGCLGRVNYVDGRRPGWIDERCNLSP